MPEGVKWIGSAANPAAAIRAALVKRYGEALPDPLTVTVTATKGGAVLVPPQETQ